MVIAQLPLLARVVPTQSSALSQTKRHWLGVMYSGWMTVKFDDSDASQCTLYEESPSMPMSTPSQTGQVTLPTSHVGVGSAGKYSSFEVEGATGTTVIVDSIVVIRRVLDWLVLCAGISVKKYAVSRQPRIDGRDMIAVALYVRHRKESETALLLKGSIARIPLHHRQLVETG